MTTTLADQQYDVVVLGAGFAGMYMLHVLRLENLSVRVFERGGGVGGTWYWNRYPGARCDVESVEYSYSFSDELQQEWTWSERYSGQPEILRYANHVAERFDLLKDIQFETEIVAAHYDETRANWRVRTSANERIECQFLIMATGCLSSANQPKIPGIDSFRGDVYHTGRWPHEEVDLLGRRIAVIGTGSSAIQAIPHIAEEAKHLTVFQRTPNFSVPARNKPLQADYVEGIKASYADFRARNRKAPAGLGANFVGNNQSALDATQEERDHHLAKRWEIGGFAFMGAFNDLGITKESNDIAAEFVRQRIKETINDPAVAEKLCPSNVIGCKRLCLDTNYFETYNRENVDLVDINAEPLQSIDARGILTDAKHYEVDSIVFATGFDAMTGTLTRIDIRGKNGLTLKSKWSEGPKTYLGLMTARFPNLFMISGPGSPSVLTNMIVSIEQHVEWIRDCISALNHNQQTVIEPRNDAEEEWVKYVNAIADLTLYPTCNSWYLGANIPGKPRVFMPHVGFPNYVERCDEIVANGYRGFDIV